MSFYKPGLFSSRPWKLSHWDVIIQNVSAPVPQSLREGRSVTWVGAFLQLVKLLPVMKMQESLIFLWLRLISKHKWPAVPLTLILRNASTLLLQRRWVESVSSLTPSLQYPWGEAPLPIHICLVQLLSQFLNHLTPTFSPV